MFLKIKAKASNTLKSLFSLKKRKRVALLKAERQAPGSEIAYIIKSNEFLDGEIGDAS